MALFLQADVLKATLATDAVIGSTVRAVIFTVKNCTKIENIFKIKIFLSFFERQT